MKHLSPSELVDAVDGAIDGNGASHVESCARCPAAIEELRGVAQRVAVEGEVPEPSPLFWDHLSARVHEGVSGERVAPVPWWLVSVRPFAPIAAAVVLLVLVSATIVIRREPPSPGVEVPRETARVEAGMDVDSTIDPANSEVWEVLTAAAADLELDDAHAAGMSVQPAAIDRAVQRMSAEELNELGRLLQSELKRAGN